MLILDVTKEDSIASALNTVMENYLDEIDVLVRPRRPKVGHGPRAN